MSNSRGHRPVQIDRPMEISTDQGQTWRDLDVIVDGTPGRNLFLVRYKATDTLLASDPTELELFLKATQTTVPDRARIYLQTDDKIITVLSLDEGIEMSRDGVVWSLLPHEYEGNYGRNEFMYRYAETDTHTAGPRGRYTFMLKLPNTNVPVVGDSVGQGDIHFNLTGIRTMNVTGSSAIEISINDGQSWVNIPHQYEAEFGENKILYRFRETTELNHSTSYVHEYYIKAVNNEFPVRGVNYEMEQISGTKEVSIAPLGTSPVEISTSRTGEYLPLPAILEMEYGWNTLHVRFSETDTMRVGQPTSTDIMLTQPGEIPSMDDLALSDEGEGRVKVLPANGIEYAFGPDGPFYSNEQTYMLGNGTHEVHFRRKATSTTSASAMIKKSIRLIDWSTVDWSDTDGEVSTLIGDEPFMSYVSTSRVGRHVIEVGRYIDRNPRNVVIRVWNRTGELLQTANVATLTQAQLDASNRFSNVKVIFNGGIHRNHTQWGGLSALIRIEQPTGSSTLGDDVYTVSMFRNSNQPNIVVRKITMHNPNKQEFGTRMPTGVSIYMGDTAFMVTNTDGNRGGFNTTAYRYDTGQRLWTRPILILDVLRRRGPNTEAWQVGGGSAAIDHSGVDSHSSPEGLSTSFFFALTTDNRLILITDSDNTKMPTNMDAMWWSMFALEWATLHSRLYSAPQYAGKDLELLKDGQPITVKFNISASSYVSEMGQNFSIIPCARQHSIAYYNMDGDICTAALNIDGDTPLGIVPSSNKITFNMSEDVHAVHLINTLLTTTELSTSTDRILVATQMIRAMMSVPRCLYLVNGHLVPVRHTFFGAGTGSNTTELKLADKVYTGSRFSRLIPIDTIDNTLKPSGSSYSYLVTGTGLNGISKIVTTINVQSSTMETDSITTEWERSYGDILGLDDSEISSVHLIYGLYPEITSNEAKARHLHAILSVRMGQTNKLYYVQLDPVSGDTISVTDILVGVNDGAPSLNMAVSFNRRTRTEDNFNALVALHGRHSSSPDGAMTHTALNVRQVPK